MKTNFTGVNIRKGDFFRLPDDQRCMTDSGPMVMSSVGGRPAFVPANIID